MSMARKCNMCQKCFDPLEEDGRMARFKNPIFQTANDIREQNRGYLLVPELGADGIIDLCPECSEDLLELFVSGKPDGKVVKRSIIDIIKDMDDKILGFGFSNQGDFDGDFDGD